MKSGSAPLKCLVVDDEPLAADLIISYIETVPELEVVAVCHNALDALTVLRSKSIDLIFLDIQMPKLTGLGFVRTVSNPPAIIFTTAYREYAVEGFELDAVDYLVKPISFERFLKAVQKLLRLEAASFPTVAVAKAEPPYIYYRVERQQVKVLLSEILYIESQRDYIKVILEGEKTLITYQRISYAEESLPTQLFLRIHRSFIVSKKKVTGYKSDHVVVGEHRLPVGNSYKQKVQMELGL